MVMGHTPTSELVFLVEKGAEGGYIATAQGCNITTKAQTLDKLKATVREAVDRFFEAGNPGRPESIALRHVAPFRY